MDEADDFARSILDTLAAYGRAQFGDAVQSYWVYDGDLCPCCLKRPIDVIQYKGRDALSLNAFMYRERGVLIGYLLCGACARLVFETPRSRQALLHEGLERNLIRAYRRFLASADA